MSIYNGGREIERTMKDEQVEVINSPESTSLDDCKGVSGASTLCGCKRVCVSMPEPD